MGLQTFQGIKCKAIYSESYPSYIRQLQIFIVFYLTIFVILELPWQTKDQHSVFAFHGYQQDNLHAHHFLPGHPPNLLPPQPQHQEHHKQLHPNSPLLSPQSLQRPPQPHHKQLKPKFLPCSLPQQHLPHLFKQLKQNLLPSPPLLPPLPQQQCHNPLKPKTPPSQSLQQQHLSQPLKGHHSRQG